MSFILHPATFYCGGSKPISQAGVWKRGLTKTRGGVVKVAGSYIVKATQGKGDQAEIYPASDIYVDATPHLL